MSVVRFAFNLYIIILFIRVLLSWFPVGSRNPIVEFIYGITEPVLEPVRRVIPPIGGGLDISPMIVLFALYFLRNIFS